jgi:hypothetical protein
VDIVIATGSTKKVNVWKPTAEECTQIRAFAKREVSGMKRLEGGSRHNMHDSSVPTSLNIALVAKKENWEDTDLSDFVPWATFRKGVELTEDGRAIIDFYVYNAWGLETNISVYYKGGKIVKLARTGRGRELTF